jgi:amino acid transporter
MSDGATTGARQASDGYGWAEGVFVPTLLTILGVILFLRTGWVVGNAGLAGGTIVILVSYAITGTTALSVASIASNTTIGSGGAYAVVTRSFGPETGGAIGIPLYLSQTLVIVLYLFGFRDGWLRIFPEHPALVVDLVGFAAIVVVAMVSAKFAFRVQYGILALIVAALGSMAMGAVISGLPESPTLWGDYPGAPDDGFTGTSFWQVLGVFFPATTGIMAGANLSGELANSRRAIPLGTLLAVGVSLVIYLATAAWLAATATSDTLVSNYLIAVDAAAWGPAVLAGLLGATFSSALASTVGAPRILHALAEHGVLPRSGWLASRAGNGEPRNALYVTAAIALAAVALRALNALAPVITLFFLVTYGTINLVVLVEQTLDLPSFRPRIRLPIAVPALGFIGSLVAMIVVNPVFTAVVIVVVVAIVIVLTRRGVDSHFSDIRGALFQRLARWASAQAKASRRSAERAWRPHLLVPTRQPQRLSTVLPYLHDITQPKGSVKLVGYGDGIADHDVARLGQRLRTADVDASWSVLDVATIADAITSGAEHEPSAGAPNIVFVDFPRSTDDVDAARAALRAAGDRSLGVIMLADSDRGRVGGRGVVNLWVRPQPPGADVETAEHSHLAILMAMKLERNWADGRMNLLTVVESEDQRSNAESYLQALIDAARLPGPPSVHVLTGGFIETLGRGPNAEANVFALGPEVDFPALREMIERTDTPCVFVRDSGEESAVI